jgi:hypothetical protein
MKRRAPVKAFVPILLRTKRWSVSAILFVGAAIGLIPNAPAQSISRVEDSARWAVRSAIPDGVDDWPVFTSTRVHLPFDLLTVGVALVCGTLDFADPSAGQTHFAVLVRLDSSWRLPLVPPVFYGSDRAANTLPLADRCDEAGRPAGSRDELRAAAASPP